MSNLCCLLGHAVHCEACNTRWCASCWAEIAKGRSFKDIDSHQHSPRICSVTKRVIGVKENRYYPTEPGIGLVFSPLP